MPVTLGEASWGPAFPGRPWLPHHSEGAAWPRRARGACSLGERQSRSPWWGGGAFHLADSPSAHQAASTGSFRAGEMLPPLSWGPEGREGTRSEATRSPLLPLRPRSLPTLPGADTVPLPSRWSSPPRSGPFPGPLCLWLGPPSITEREPGQASLSEPLSRWQEDGWGAGPRRWGWGVSIRR